MNTRELRKSDLFEFIRYVFVGGIAFGVDFLVLYLCEEIIFKGVRYSLYISNVLSFMAGIIVNYILSLKLVFLSVKDTKLGKRTRDQFLFVIIGVIGLLITELGMFIGVELFSVYYLIVKVIVAGIVMFWNYIARKKLIFNTKYLEQ